MPELTQDIIDRLLNVKKFILDDVEWQFESTKRRKMSFKVNVLSEEENMFELRGYYGIPKGKTSLTLLYRTIPLVSVHYGRHANPTGAEPESVNGWHKHKFSELYERDLAIDVSDEFERELAPEAFLEEFKRENNIEYAPGKRYVVTFVYDFGKQ